MNQSSEKKNKLKIITFMKNDILSDSIMRIRNAGLAGHSSVLVHAIFSPICKILKKNGYIEDTYLEGPFNKILLKYVQSKSLTDSPKPCISTIKRLSKPSLRLYVNSKKLASISNNMGIIIISTNQGIMTDKEALKKKLGGELICYVC